MGVLGDDWGRQRSAEILADLAQNPGSGGAAGAVAGVGFGVAASGVFNEMANQMFRGNASQEGRSPLDGARTQSRRYAEPIDESVAISCASCHTELPAGAKFCIKCGQTVGQNQCASCGTDVGLDAQFCPNCGTRIRSSDG